MLQCPNCKEYCISYIDTLQNRLYSLEMCGKCFGYYRIPLAESFKRIFIPLIGISIILFIEIWILRIESKIITFCIAAIVYFATDYLLYINMAPLEIATLTKDERRIIYVDKNQLLKLMNKLARKSKNDAFIVLYENDNSERYLLISYDNYNYKLSLALKQENMSLEKSYIAVASNHGINIIKNKVDEEIYLDITLADDKTNALEKIECVFKTLFNQKEVKYFAIITFI